MTFGLDTQINAENISIYDCNSEKFYDRFDIGYFPGVIYHLSDPLVALRILFNSLNPGGTVLVESAGIQNEEPFCQFDGSLICHSRPTKMVAGEVGIGSYHQRRRCIE